MKRTPLARASTLFLLVFLLVWPGSAQAQEKSAIEKVRIAIATHSLAFLVSFVAKDRRFYTKYGLEAELI